jgi:tetratricopeptide (TPR) repeat protein
VVFTVPTELPAGSNARHPQLPEPLRSAVIAHEDGQLETAYPLYRKFVAGNPKNATALQLFGLLLSQLGQYDYAIVMMRESLKLFPDQAEVANNLGNALLQQGRVDEAVASYKDAIRIYPGYVDALRNLGLCHLRAGNPGEAVKPIERCIELRPTDAAAWLVLGNIRRKQNDMDAAVTSFEKALELQPDYAEAHHNLGVCLRLQHHPEEALEHYEKARELGMDRAELYHNIGNAKIDTQEAGPAIDAYRQALSRNTGDIETHKNLNSLLWQQSLLEDYLESYKEVLEKEPSAHQLRMAYATALNQKESYMEAEQVLREGVQLAADSSDMRSLLAYTLEGCGRWEEALETHAAATAMPNANPNQLVSYGRALLACDKPEEALRQVRAGAALTPFNQRALAYLGLCWRVLGDERDAMLNDYDTMIRSYNISVPEGFGSVDEFNQRLQAMLERLHIGLQHPAEQTLRKGSQTSGNLFDRRDPEIVALIKALEPCIEDYILSFPRSNEHPLYSRRTSTYGFHASWSVRLFRSGYHTNHTHPLGWISSAYYVQVPPEVSENDERGGGIKFGEPDIDIGDIGKPRMTIQPSVGQLVLFPSYMWHGTVPFESDEPRMTAPFDVVPT